MAGQSVINTAGGYALGITQNPVLNQNSDTAIVPLAFGRHGEVLETQIHGKRFIASIRGNTFWAGAHGFTGVAPLAPAGTTAGFAFWNPAGSGVNMEIHKLRIMPLTATDVVGGIGLEYGAQAPTSGTLVTPVSMPIGPGGNTPKCKASYGSTIVAMSYLGSLFFVESTGGLIQGWYEYDGDGTLVLGPGGAVNIVSTTTQSANAWLQDVIWSEWLV